MLVGRTYFFGFREVPGGYRACYIVFFCFMGVMCFSSFIVSMYFVLPVYLLVVPLLSRSYYIFWLVCHYFDIYWLMFIIMYIFFCTIVLSLTLYIFILPETL